MWYLRVWLCCDCKEAFSPAASRPGEVHNASMPPTLPQPHACPPHLLSPGSRFCSCCPTPPRRHACPGPPCCTLNLCHPVLRCLTCCLLNTASAADPSPSKQLHSTSPFSTLPCHSSPPGNARRNPHSPPPPYSRHTHTPSHLLPPLSHFCSCSLTTEDTPSAPTSSRGS